MTARPVKFVLVAEGNERAPGSFWPELSVENSQAWLVGDPGAIKLTNKGLSLEKGSAGNFLLTRRSDYRKCSMSITLAAFENAEAYLALCGTRDRTDGTRSPHVSSARVERFVRDTPPSTSSRRNAVARLPRSLRVRPS